MSISPAEISAHACCGGVFVPGADAAALFDLAQGHVGGEGVSSGSEHPAAPDCGLRHPRIHAGAHRRTRL